MTIRLATAHDAAQIPITMARAFIDYGWNRWTVDPDDHYSRLVDLYTIFVAEFGRSLDAVWVSDDVASVAAWLPPGIAGPDDQFIQKHGDRLALLHGCRFEAALAANDAVGEYRPQERHWYLASMATHPDFQGRGLGAQVLRPVLELCDRDGLPAYTDTVSEDNLRFYAKQGFEVHAEAELPDAGPHIWFLHRQPQ